MLQTHKRGLKTAAKSGVEGIGDEVVEVGWNWTGCQKHA